MLRNMKRMWQVVMVMATVAAIVLPHGHGRAQEEPLKDSLTSREYF